MRNPILTLGVGLIIGLLIAVGAYLYGVNAGQAQAASQTQQFFQSRGATGTGGTGGTGGFAGAGGAGAGAFAGRGTGAGGGATVGTISKVDGNTLTLTVANQGDVTVSLPANIAITKTVTGTVADLVPGTQVLVRGQQSGTNIAATNIQITPAGAAGFFGRGGPGRDLTPSPTTP